MANQAPEDAVVPGTDPDSTAQDSSAGTQNTDSGPPDAIPYARFKEVNDQLRPFKELENMGYGADSLRQLAEWDAAFAQDPVAVWRQIGENIELPDELKEALETAGGETPGADHEPANDGKPDQHLTDDKPPEWAEPIIRDYFSRQEADEKAAYDRILDDVLSGWEKLDKEQDIDRPPTEKQKLTFIAAHAEEGASAEEILEAARGDALDYRKSVLEGTVQRPGAPRSVPGSAAPSGGEKPQPKTLAEATQMAKQDLLSTGDWEE